jgi:starch synthase
MSLLLVEADTVATADTPRGADVESESAGAGAALSVVHFVAEYFPYARSGGLAEAVRGIATFQARHGVETLVFLPLYRIARERATNLTPIGDPFEVALGPARDHARLFDANEEGPGPRVVFVDHPGLFDRDGLYGAGGQDYPDNHIRFAFFVKAALTALPGLVEQPVVVHAHDWHTALAPVYLRTTLADDPWYARVATVLSVHNAGYPGLFGPEILEQIGLPPEVNHWSRMEHYGAINCLKGGLAYSDFVATVSPTHAYELRTPAGGFGLHDSFIALGDRLVGILNGIDVDVWDPSRDPILPANFSADDLDGKKACKRDLQERTELPVREDVPVFGMTARLVQQKGFDLLLGDGLLYRLPEVQFVFVGEGEERYRHLLAEAARHMPDRVWADFDFSEEKEHRLLAGADALLMPSLYEPCGLTQMRAQRYGALPVVRRVGGLSDTVEDQVTGFVFDEYSSAGLERAIRRALALFEDRAAWERHMRTAMERDFGWARSAERYLELYRDAVRYHGSE